MELALYSDGSDPTFPFIGYYKSEQQKSARRGDYITSVEVGPLFGAVLARALDFWWEEAGSPEEFYVFDVGCGVGTLARSILRAEPACMDSLKYILVEQSEYLISQHKDLLSRQDVSITSLRTDLSAAIPHPEVDFGVVVANELLDNLPVMLMEKTSQGWAEVGVVLEEKTTNVLGEELIQLDSDSLELLTQLLPDQLVPATKASATKEGQRIPIQKYARQWVKGAASVLKQGRILVFDYGVLTTAELSNRPQEEWLRTYRAQSAGQSPYQAVGQQDISCEVAIDQLNLGQLNSAQPNSTAQSQSDFLKQWGIDELVAEAKVLDQNITPTNLKDIELQSRITEAEALLDPMGLGSHWAIEWVL